MSGRHETCLLQFPVPCGGTRLDKGGSADQGRAFTQSEAETEPFHHCRAGGGTDEEGKNGKSAHGRDVIRRAPTLPMNKPCRHLRDGIPEEKEAGEGTCL